MLPVGHAEKVKIKDNSSGFHECFIQPIEIEYRQSVISVYVKHTVSNIGIGYLKQAVSDIGISQTVYV